MRGDCADAPGNRDGRGRTRRRRGAAFVCTYRHRRQSTQPGQIIRSPDHERSHLGPLLPLEACPPESAHGFEPTEDLFDTLPYPLADGIAGVPGGARIDGRAARGGDVLGHMWRDLARPTGLHEHGIIIALVRPQGDARRYRGVLVLSSRRSEPRSSFRRARRRGPRGESRHEDGRVCLVLCAEGAAQGGFREVGELVGEAEIFLQHLALDLGLAALAEHALQAQS